MSSRRGAAHALALLCAAAILCLASAQADDGAPAAATAGGGSAGGSAPADLPPAGAPALFAPVDSPQGAAQAALRVMGGVDADTSKGPGAARAAAVAPRGRAWPSRWRSRPR
jgi:hypothetical protein